MNVGLIDILFLATVVLLVFNGFRNGAVVALAHLLSIPIGAVVAYYYGPRFTALLSVNGFSATPLVAYLVIFFGAVLVCHILGTIVGSVVKRLPLIGLADSLIGAVLGVVEAWLLWVVFLFILGSFLMHTQATSPGAQGIIGANVSAQQLQAWRDFYNQAVNNSFFAQTNSFFIKSFGNVY
ncbi:MAG TPA: CvpA family protein [Ktedonobacteraceae bacterium]